MTHPDRIPLGTLANHEGEPETAPEMAAAVYRLACGCPISNGKNPLGNWTCVVHGPTTMIGESAAQPAPELTPGQAGDDAAFWAWMDAYVDEPHNASYEVPDMQRAYEAGQAAGAVHASPASLCSYWSDPSDDFHGVCVKEAYHDREGDPEHENKHGIRWTGQRWEG